MIASSENRIRFASKADTLALLRTCLSSARVLDQVLGTVDSWSEAPNRIISEISGKEWLDKPLIVRSSARGEDTAKESMAGHFLTVSGVIGIDAIHNAIESVIASYANHKTKPDGGEQFLFNLI